MILAPLAAAALVISVATAPLTDPNAAATDVRAAEERGHCSR